jgi:hypothetical protein
MPREGIMDLKRSAWLPILAAAIVMAVACFVPALVLINGEVWPGWFAAALSGVGTFMGIAEGNGKLAAICGLGLLANVMFIVALLATILRQVFHWKRPGHRMLSLCVIIGILAGAGSIFPLHPIATRVGAWLWLVAQATLALGLWILPHPQGRRGFEVLSIAKAASVLPLSVANPSKT